MKISYRLGSDEDALGAQQCRILSWQSAYRGVVSDEFLDGMTEKVASSTERMKERMHSKENDTFILVAENENGKIVGFLEAGRNRESDGEDSEVYCVYVHPDFQGRGIGKQLVRRGFRQLKKLGYRSTIIWTLWDTPQSNAFYISLGGRHRLDGNVEIGDRSLRLRGYSWML